MAKVEVEFELGGFRIDRVKLRIKADREDIPRINGALEKQFMNVLQPAPGLFDEVERKQIPSNVVPPANTDKTNPAGSSRGSRRTKNAGNGATAVTPLDWQHVPSKWGMPKQKWKAGQKVLWILYVIKNEVDATELSAATMAETFNAKFKQFGALKRTSMPSILASLKTNEPTLIMDDTTKTPALWFLSEEGVKAAELLVQEAKTVEAGAAGQ